MLAPHPFSLSLFLSACDTEAHHFGLNIPGEHERQAASRRREAFGRTPKRKVTPPACPIPLCFSGRIGLEVILV